MSEHDKSRLRTLLHAQELAALGTLHKGEPAVSMVPYALLPDTATLVVHVSTLATHTQDMLAHAGVSLLVMDGRHADVPPQAVARAILQAQASRCPPDAAEHALAREAYLRRFPQSAPMFDFSDFSLFLLRTRSARFVGGFAQAWSIQGEALLTLMRQGA